MRERAPFSKQNGHTSDNLADTKNMISGQRDKDEARAHLREYQHYFLDILGNSEKLNISEKVVPEGGFEPPTQRFSV
ncbi:MAG: hypothetical protein AAGM33_11560, partial [Pseudomonadota bacterium]